MFKQLSLSQNVYRQSRVESPKSVIDFEDQISESILRDNTQKCFNRIFSEDDETFIHHETGYTDSDCFQTLNITTIIDELEKFIEITQLIESTNSLNVLHYESPLNSLLTNHSIPKISKKLRNVICNKSNPRWTNFIKLVFDGVNLNQNKIRYIKEKLHMLKYHCSQDLNEDIFTDSLKLYYDLMHCRLIKVSDFVDKQTLVIYKSDSSNKLRVSLSGENQLLRALLKRAVPNLLTRPSEKFFDQLTENFTKLIMKVDNLEEINHFNTSELDWFLHSCYQILSDEVKKDSFKDNFRQKFNEYNTNIFEIFPAKHSEDMTDLDIESYFHYDSTKLNSKQTYKQSISKLFQALFVSKMWCAEKSIMHDLLKDNEFMQLGNVQAFVLSKYLQKDRTLKKSEIPVCLHCKMTNFIVSSTDSVTHNSRVSDYSQTPNKTPRTNKYCMPIKTTFKPIKLFPVDDEINLNNMEFSK